jgi:O-antigen/teichoic acid export membrane protein
MPQPPASTAEPHEARATEFRPSSIAAGGFDALIFRGIELVSKVAIVVITGRLMEPAGRGLYALASLVISLCGLPFGAVWLANAVEVARRRVGVRELLGASILIAIVGGLATGALAFAVAPLLGDRWWVVALPAAVTPFVLLSRYQEGLYMSLGHVRAVNLIRVGRAVLPLLFIAPPLLAGASPSTAIAVWTLAFAALPALVFFPLRGLVGPPRVPREPALYRRLVSYGTRIALFDVVPVLNDRVALLALAVFATDAAVGVFSIAIAATEVVLLATQALVLAAFRRIGSDSREASAALTARTIRHNMVLATGGSVVLVPAVYVAIPWALGAGYEQVPLLLVLLLPNMLYMASVAPLYTFFSVQAERPTRMLRVTTAALATNVLLAVALAPLWGTTGVAVAASLAGLIGGVVAFRTFAADAGIHMRDLRPGRRELRDYLAFGASLASAWGRGS